MTIVWMSDMRMWAVMEDEVEVGRFPSLLAAETWIIEETERREAAT